MNFKEETLQIAQGIASQLGEEFIQEIKHLFGSGAIDSENHNRGLLFGVAIENIADKYIRNRNSEYENLKCF